MKPLQMFLLAADKLIRCRWDGRSEGLEVVNTALEGETLREVAQDPANPQRLYAATLTEIHVSEDGGESWKWLPAGGIDFRDIWAMAAHPTRPNEIYVGTLPAAVYVSENGGRSFRELSAFRRLPEYNKWTFPPPPHTAHIRCITLMPGFRTKSSSASKRAAWRAAEIEEKAGRISAAHPAPRPIRSITTLRAFSLTRWANTKTGGFTATFIWSSVILRNSTHCTLLPASAPI